MLKASARNWPNDEQVSEQVNRGTLTVRASFVFVNAQGFMREKRPLLVRDWNASHDTAVDDMRKLRENNPSLNLQGNFTISL